jgi:hypothetical protein
MAAPHRTVDVACDTSNILSMGVCALHRASLLCSVLYNCGVNACSAGAATPPHWQACVQALGHLPPGAGKELEV